MPFCNFVFLFRSFHELKVKNQRRCVPLGGRASHLAEQVVRRVVEFHSTGNHYSYIYILFYNNFKGSIPFLLILMWRIEVSLFYFFEKHLRLNTYFELKQALRLSHHFDDFGKENESYKSKLEIRYQKIY